MLSTRELSQIVIPLKHLETVIEEKPGVKFAKTTQNSIYWYVEYNLI